MTAWKYTDARNSVVFRFLEDGRMESCLASALPEGTEVTPADPPPQPSPQEQIDKIEADTKMNRAVREGMLLLIEREAMREFGVDLPTAQAGLYAGNPAYRRIKDIDNQIAALRTQM